jgi:hypothetical protein
MENAFTYMMSNGPVIHAGHTMGYEEEGISYLFDEAPEDLEYPFDTYGVLQVTKRTA